MDVLKHCVLCPRRCGADRTAGETGFCGLPGHLVVDCALAHLGEEPPLSGRHGSGTIFFSSCNLRCVFCQNHQISHGTAGRKMTPAGLARIMLDLQDDRCHNINAVTPTPQAPLIIEGLRQARAKGLEIPFVYNCGGYEDIDIIRHISGDVDIYLPDFKFGSDEAAHLLTGVGDYVATTLTAIEEMVRQVGEGLYLDSGIAVRGLLVRRLVLPGLVENSIAALDMIRTRLSPEVALSIMSQYAPIPAMKQHMTLCRRVTVREYETVVNHALALGFENIYIQEVDDRHLLPDFDQERPFLWE
ncbi:MAG: radical SAM protein [Syntrophus sp. (in: bacteria)]|nr:radical SAM protein [Syntrophus sp. (in: bacteria)]